MGERVSLRTRFLARASLVAVLPVGCAAAPATDPSSDAGTECSAPSTCPGDPPPTEFDVDTCEDELRGGCGPSYQRYYDCYAGRRVCAYDGTTDVLATQQACAAELEAVIACGDGGAPP